jgi:hypothetical protein
MAGGDAEARIVLKGVDENASSTIRKAKGELAGLSSAQKDASDSTMKANISFMAQVQAMHALSGGFNMVVNSANNLGFVSASNLKILQAATAVMNLFVGAGMMIKGVIGLVNALRASEAALTVIKALQVALIPFIGPILVGIALGTMALVAGKLAGYYQTAPGESRVIRETGPAVVHKGETIGRPAAGGGGSINVTINAGSFDMGSYIDRWRFAKAIRKEVGAT